MTSTDIEQLSKHTGYTVDEIERYFPPIQVEYDTSGFAQDRFGEPPETGVHPRISFGPDNLPDIRGRLADTRVGRAAMGKLREELNTDLTGPKARTGKLYEGLAVGDASDYQMNQSFQVGNLLQKEALRCLLDNDAEAGMKVASAIVTLARIMAQELARVNPTVDWQSTIEPIIGRDRLGLAYDYAHCWMTETQRDIVRGMITAATVGKWSIGMDALPAWEANMMNWIPWLTGELMIMACAIEGEDGHDPQLYARTEAAYERFIMLGFFESGASYEGMGKNSPRLWNLIPMAKRGNQLITSTHARNFIRNFRLHTMQPWGGCWTEDGNWGGSENRAHVEDFIAMKYAFPHDAVVDFLYRNALEGNEDSPANYAWHNGSLLFAGDWDGSLAWEATLERIRGELPDSFFCNDRGLVVTRSAWEPEAVQLYFQPRSILGGHRAGSRNTFTLSGLGRVWAEYPHLAGGSFVGDITASRYHSVILIDGENQALGPPAQMVAFEDTSEATFAVGDARLAYSVRRSRPGEEALPLTPNQFRLHRGEQPWMDLAFTDLPDWYSSQKLKAGDRRNQRYHVNDGKLYDPLAQHERTWERSWSLRDDPVQRAFRTVGLIRGKHPYVLVLDDIQKDNNVHDYHWLMQLADDLEVVSIVATDTEGGQIAINYKGTRPNYLADIVLCEGKVQRDEKGKPQPESGDRLLLVRVLQSEGDITADELVEREGNRHNLPNEISPHAAKGTLPWRDGYPGYLETYLKYPRWHTPGKRLVLPSRSVAPNFKVLLFPHYHGEELPTTVWGKDRNSLLIEWSTQRDEYTFRMGEDGRTHSVLNRD